MTCCLLGPASVGPLLLILLPRDILELLERQILNGLLLGINKEIVFFLEIAIGIGDLLVVLLFVRHLGTRPVWGAPDLFNFQE